MSNSNDTTQQFPFQTSVMTLPVTFQTSTKITLLVPFQTIGKALVRGSPTQLVLQQHINTSVLLIVIRSLQLLFLDLTDPEFSMCTC